MPERELPNLLDPTIPVDEAPTLDAAPTQTKLQRALRGGFAAATIGLSTLGSYHLVENFIVPNLPAPVQRILDPERVVPIERADGLEGLIQNYKNKYKDQFTVELAQELLAQDYTNVRNALSQIVGYERNTNHTELEEFTRSRRQALVLDGTHMLKGYFGKGEIEINKEKGEIFLPETPRALDINNTYDAILLDQYIVYTMQSKTTKDPAEIMRAEQNIKNIEWLMQATNLDIEIVDDSAFIFQDDSLAKISKLCQILERNNHSNFPPIKIFSSLDGVGGLYMRPGINSSKGDRIHTINEGIGAILTHEFAHFVAAESDSHGQNAFDEKIRQTKERLKGLGYTTDGPQAFVSDYAKKNNHEDYADTFWMFFDEGIEFRNKLKLLAVTNPAEFEILLTKYDFMKEFFGNEFLTDGEDFEPQINDFFNISDPDPQKEAIGLRVSPESKVLSGTVFNNYIIQIIDGPIETYYPFTKSNSNFYKVRMIYQAGDSVEGWISAIWFGEKIEAPKPKKN